ncbi:unnamed protein product [Rotaria sordida]|uniref:Polyadenylate-binding protein n=1 Tax=Rotaria sordida TaxID=392033 RepID=A0A814XNN0_9BILA|nr:unnamed protein product [Rotaria sordida]
MASSSDLLEAPIISYPSLRVDNLHPDVNEAMLFDKFASVGPISSIRVFRNTITRRSLGYAEVNFQLAADAEYVFDTMNFDLLHGRPLRIMRCQRDSALCKSDITKVFIENLDERIDDKLLYDTFSAFGNVLSCKIMTDENNQSKGYGFVHFETQDAADNAIQKVNGMSLADKKVHVSRLMSSNQQVDVDGARQLTNIFINNFGDQLDEEKLREILSKHGKVLSCKIEYDESGHSKGFAFCSFENPKEAEEAVQNLNGYSIGDKQLWVGRFQTKSEQLSEITRKKDLQRQERMNKYQNVNLYNLYISNLDDTIDDERLKKEFSKFGTITSARVMAENGRSRGFGFVSFSTTDEAAKAITEMNGSFVGSKPLYVALAQRKKERRMHLTNHHMQYIATAHVSPQMQLPFPNGMCLMMPYLLTPMDPSQPWNFSSSTPMPTYQLLQPCWSSPVTTNAMRPQTSTQMIGIQISPSAMTDVASRSTMPIGTQPTSKSGQMMPDTSVRPLVGVQSQQATAYTRTARNIPPNNPTGFSDSIVVAEQEPLTLAALANATPLEQKQMLGERLFPLIQQIQLQLVGKITGMLLEIDNIELLHMLESTELLKAKFEEAIGILQTYQAKQAATNSAAQKKSYIII